VPGVNIEYLLNNLSGRCVELHGKEVHADIVDQVNLSDIGGLVQGDVDNHDVSVLHGERGVG